MNLYAYVGNDPVNSVDPSGMVQAFICDSPGGRFFAYARFTPKMEAAINDWNSAQKGQQSEEGGWTRIGNVIGEGERGTFRAGPKIKIEGGDDRVSIHLNYVPYKCTFTEIGPDGKPIAGVYPLYEGVLSTALSGAFATERVFELYGPANTKFDWTFEIVPFEKTEITVGNQ